MANKKKKQLSKQEKHLYGDNARISKITTKKHLARQQREAKQTRIILIITIVVGIIIVGLVAYGLIDQLIVKPRIRVAKVGDTTIRLKAFQKNVQYQRVQAINQAYQFYDYYTQFGEFGASFLETAQTIVFGLIDPVQFGTNVANSMVNDLIIREEAAKRNLTVSPEEVEQELQAVYFFFPQGTFTPSATATILSTPTLSETQKALVTETPTPTATSLFPDATIMSQTPSEDQEEVEETQATVIPTPTEQEGKVDLLPATLTPTPTITLSPTPYTTVEYGANLGNFEAYYAPYNFDLDDLRYIIEGELLREKLLEEITKDMSPIEEQVWARHILVETEEEALDILSKLDEGQDFGALAQEYSIDESNSEAGGDLGWFNRNTMVDEFTNVAFTLDVGEISEPVETEFGFHIIQNLGYRDNQKTASAFSSEKSNTFNDWLADLRESLEQDGEIVIYEGWEKYVPGTPEVPQQFLMTLLQLQQ